MLSYESLDTVADSYIPALLAFAILCCVPVGGEARTLRFGLRMSSLTLLAAVTYGLMYLDQFVQIWPRMGLDFSTHTALALSLVIWLQFCWARGRIAWWASFALYVALMLYQRYHTLTDIVSTAAVIGPIAWLIVQQGARLTNDRGQP